MSIHFYRLAHYKNVHPRKLTPPIYRNIENIVVNGSSEAFLQPITQQSSFEICNVNRGGQTMFKFSTFHDEQKNPYTHTPTKSVIDPSTTHESHEQPTRRWNCSRGLFMKFVGCSWVAIGFRGSLVGQSWLSLVARGFWGSIMDFFGYRGKSRISTVLVPGLTHIDDPLMLFVWKREVIRPHIS